MKFLSQFSGIFLLQITNLFAQIFVLPILINYADSISVGAYFLSLSFASLAGIFVNYGTNQATIIELQRSHIDKDKNRLAKIYSEAFSIRFFPLTIAVIVAIVLGFIHSLGFYFIICILMIIAEFMSPLFYLLAFQQLKLYVVVNFIFKFISFIILWVFRNENWLVEIAVLLPGLTMIIQNLIMIIIIKRRDNLQIKLNFSKSVVQTIRIHTPLVINNMTVHLQQSVFLFSISGVATPVFLSAYGFIDKVVGSTRLVISSYNASFIPIATSTHHESFNKWKNLKNKHNLIITVLSLIAAAVMFFFSKELVWLFLLGGEEKSVEFITLTGQLIQMISLVPLMIALNALNIMELLMENRFNDYLMAGIIVLLFSASGAVFTRLGLKTEYLGFYPFYIEMISLLIYLFFVLRNRKNHL